MYALIAETLERSCGVEASYIDHVDPSLGIMCQSGAMLIVLRGYFRYGLRSLFSFLFFSFVRGMRHGSE